MSSSARDRFTAAREVAVRTDTRPGLLSAARWLRRRLPGDERFGDPLSTAGRQPVQVLARGVSALQPERESALHELGMGALQVWQALSEKSGRGRGTSDVALLFTDLVSFSPWALQAGDTAVVRMLRDVGEVLEDRIAAERGRIVKRLGDGLMAVFLSSGDAVEAALSAIEGLEDVSVDGERPRMRAGVHFGRPRRLGGDYLGVDVNIAARVGAAAKASELLVSDVVADGLDGARYEVGRARRLKASGAPRDLRVCRVSRRPS